uniref:RRM domain-containing protein n=1 Tax=Dracunculus medinensis TaxID=318479 RepID=A0A0N4UBV6_DRAME
MPFDSELRNFKRLQSGTAENLSRLFDYALHDPFLTQNAIGSIERTTHENGNFSLNTTSLAKFYFFGDFFDYRYIVTTFKPGNKNFGYTSTSEIKLNETGNFVAPVFSRKVFVGGLPHGVTANTITEFFNQFGTATVDWPHRDQNKRYAFVVFEKESSVQILIENCTMCQGKLNIILKNKGKNLKMVQVRPWLLSEQEYRISEAVINDRYSVFVGGVPRTTSARELAVVIQQTIGNVSSVTLELDSDTQYPKGAARVVFKNRESYLIAIAMRMITINKIDQEKEFIPIIFALKCLVCSICVKNVGSHNRGLLYHKPMLKERCKMKAQNAEQTSEHVLNATFLQHQKQKKYWQRHQQQQYEQKQLMQEKNHAYYPTKRFQVNNRDR